MGSTDVITRKATDVDIIAILDHLSEQTLAELKAMGLDRGKSLALARSFMLRGETDVALIDGIPACICGIFPDKGVMTTWFLASTAYFASATAVLHGRRWLKAAVKRHGPFWTTTKSQHPDVVRWFDLMGYHQVRESGDTRVFRYG